MKKSLIIIAAIIMIAGLTNRVMAQTGVSATEPNDANATVLSAITLAVDAPLEFGAFFPHATIAGTVTINLLDGRTSTSVTEVDGTVTPSSAAYTTTGTKGAVYSITLPSTVEITNSGVAGSGIMEITGMTCTGGLTPHTLDAVTGTDVFFVGGVLAVGAAQQPGLYTGAFDVIVEY